MCHVITKEILERVQGRSGQLGEHAGVTLKQIGEELGVNPHLLGKWRKQLQATGESAAFPGHGHPRDEELSTLKRELNPDEVDDHYRLQQDIPCDRLPS